MEKIYVQDLEGGPFFIGQPLQYEDGQRRRRHSSCQSLVQPGVTVFILFDDM